MCSYRKMTLRQTGTEPRDFVLSIASIFFSWSLFESVRRQWDRSITDARSSQGECGLFLTVQHLVTAICVFSSFCSIQKKVGDIMKEAFWDALQEKLREDPPDFSHAIVLLEEVKQVL